MIGTIQTKQFSHKSSLLKRKSIKKSINFGQGRKHYEPYLLEAYTRPTSRNNTVAIVGSAKDAVYTKPFEKMVHDLAFNIVASGRNLLNGCCEHGLVRKAFDGANKAKNLHNAGEHLGIIVGWKEELTDNVKIIGKAIGEEQRMKNITQCAKTIIAFPGSLTLGIENLNFMNLKRHEESDSNLIIVGKKFFRGFDLQLNDMHREGALEIHPSKLYTLVDNTKDIFKRLPKLK